MLSFLRIGSTLLGLCCLALLLPAHGPAAAAAAGTSRDAPPYPGPTAHRQQEEVPDEILATGESVFVDQCASCHGDEGKGDGPAARFLDPKPRDLSDDTWEYVEDGSIEGIVEVVRRGIDDTGMTPFVDILTDEEMRAVASYVVVRLGQEQGGRVSR